MSYSEMAVLGGVGAVFAVVWLSILRASLRDGGG